MVFYTLFLQFYWKMGKKKKTIPFWRTKTEEKQNSATIIISVDGKETASPVKLKLREKSFE